jgi:alpha-beta hydrolase superfamily lysophospholipase
MPGRRGDVDHVDQQEWDIADLVKAIAAEAPVRRLLVGGHSIGGGLALRYASGNQAPKPAAVLLLSPYVSRQAPSSRPDSGGWAAPRVTRFAGIEMLHRFGVSAFDHLPVVEFAVSPSRRDGLETPLYSWRLFNSVIPRADWEADIKRIEAPILVLGAEKDVIFRSEGYQAAFAGNPKATVDIVPGVGHFELSLMDEAPVRFARWLAAR